MWYGKSVEKECFSSDISIKEIMNTKCCGMKHINRMMKVSEQVIEHKALGNYKGDRKST